MARTMFRPEEEEQILLKALPVLLTISPSKSLPQLQVTYPVHTLSLPTV